MNFTDEEVETILDGLRKAQREVSICRWIRFQRLGERGVRVVRADGMSADFEQAFVRVPKIPDFPEWLP